MRTALPVAAPRREAVTLALAVPEAGALGLGLTLGLGLALLPPLGEGGALGERAELREGRGTEGEGEGVGLPPLLLPVAQLEAEAVGLP